jgi:excinuclease ABC subunit B
VAVSRSGGAPTRVAEAARGPRKPTLDEMGPGPESRLYRPELAKGRSTLGKPGMRGGFKPRGR